MRVWMGVVALAMWACSGHEGAESPERDAGDAGDWEGDGEAGVLCPGEVGEGGVCLPLRPRGTPPEACPSGRWAPHAEFEGSGICLPEAPRLVDWSCPDGWQSVPLLAEADGARLEVPGVSQVSRCVPPEPPERCGAGERRALGSTECVPLGPRCPGSSGTWPSESELRARADGFGGSVIYVAEAGDDADADGTETRPWRTVTAALAVAERGDIVALAVGRYVERVEVERAVALVGSCVEGTVLEAPAVSSAGTLSLGGTGGALVSGLRVTGPALGIQVAQTEGPCEIVDVEVSEVAEAGVRASHGAEPVTLRSVRIADVEEAERDGLGGAGVEAMGVEVTLDGVTIERSRAHGVFADGASTHVRLADVWIEGVRAGDSALDPGAGVSAVRGADVDAEGLVVRDCHVFGVWGTSGGDGGSENTVIRVRNAVIEGTLADSGGTLGYGAWALTGTTVELDQVSLVGNREYAVGGQAPAARGTESTRAVVRLRDVLIADTGPGFGGFYGIGVAAQEGSRVEAERLVVLRSRDVGVVALNDEEDVGRFGRTEVSISDGVVAQVLPRAAGDGFGMGVFVRGHSRADLERVVVWQARTNGIRVDGQDNDEDAPLPTVVLTDVTISETMAQAGDDTLGVGISLVASGECELERVSLDRNRYFGVLVAGMLDRRDDWARAHATDLIVSEVYPQGSDASGGAGIVVVAGGEFHLTRGLVEGTRATGIHASLEEGPWGARRTVMGLTDVVVDGVEFEESSLRYGLGVTVALGTDADLERVRVLDAETAGLLVTGYMRSVEGADPDVRATDVEVSGVGEQECSHPGVDARLACPGLSHGAGIVFGGACSGEIERFLSAGNAQVGVQLSAGPILTARDGTISNNPIGINMSRTEIDLSRDFVRVVTLGNGVALDTDELPLPVSPVIGGAE